MNRYILFALCCFLAIFSCGTTEYDQLDFPKGSQDSIDNAKIIAQLKAQKVNDASFTKSGIYYVIKEKGKGNPPDETMKITANYKGMLLDGTVFDSSEIGGKPINFQLSGVMEGWKKIIPLLGKGGKIKFWLPSKLGFGDSEIIRKKIPANSVLVFEVEILDYR